MSKLDLPSSFITSIQQKLHNDEFVEFVDSLQSVSPTSIRVNQHKYQKDTDLEQVLWCEKGYYLPERPIFTLDPTFHAGAYYVQEASSMFIGHLLTQLGVENGNVKVLDLSAAPGGKSTLIASILNHHGLLVANEIVKNRAYTLKYNLSKEGYSNVIVTNNDPKDFTELESFFDIILIDAPCSGEGMFRKDPNAISEWSVDNVTACSLRQKKIISDVLPSLKGGGYLIYSTCTYNDNENIDNVSACREAHSMESVKVKLPKEWLISEIEQNHAIGYQFYPHRTKGEGFFAAVLQKPMENGSSTKWKSSDKNLPFLDKKLVDLVSPWAKIDDRSLLLDKVNTIHLVPTGYVEGIRVLSNYLRIIYCGTSVGVLNKNIIIPDHSLALSLDRSDEISTIDLSLADALAFLKKELLTVDSNQKSWNLATYNGLSIGWLKNLGNRINNYLPAEYRILMNIH